VDPSLHLKPGSRVGDYIVDHELGRGGSAVVYSARRAPDAPSFTGVPQGPLALKLQHLDQPEARKRFVREFETLRELRIPGIAEVYEAGEHERLLWFSMQQVDGTDFREKLQGIPDIRARVLAAAQLGAQLCQVLTAIHRHGYIHRDIKPGNVLVDTRNQLVVLDFGVVQGTVAGTPITMPGSVLGTFPFMAPEQIAGLRLSDRLDVFAAGLLIYEGIIGPRPSPPKPHEWLSVQCLERPVPLSCISQAIPRRISAVLEKMLSFHPGDRPTAEDASEMLIQALRKEGAVEWPDPPRFIEAGDLLQKLVVQAEGKGPRVTFLRGPTGSGCRRSSEQLQRRAILRGLWTLKASSRLDRPGALVGEWLRQLLGRTPDREWRDRLCGDDGPLLAVMWPDLPVIWTLPEERPTIQQVAAAAARVLCRVSTEQPLLLVAEDFTFSDSLTTRTVRALAEMGEKHLTVLCLSDPRWETERCRRLISELVDRGLALDLQPSPLDPLQAERLVRSMQPNRMVATPGSGTALRVVEHGLQSLAKWRSEPLPKVPREAWVLGLTEVPLPGSVLKYLGLDPEELLESQIIRGTPQRGVVLANQALRTQCLSFMEDRLAEEDRLATAIASAWIRDPRAHAEHARHRLHGSQPERALVPAIDATLHAVASGRMNEARRWLLVIDQLPRDADNQAYQARRFDLAVARARVGMATQPRAPRADLVGQARRRARTPVQQARARLLEASLEARYGTGEIAISQLNALINQVSSVHVDVAVAALAEQGDLFLQRGDHARARAAVVRAEELRGARRPDFIQSRMDRIRADALAQAGALEAAVQRCNAALALAEELDLQRSQARIKLRLSSIRLAMRQLEEANELAWQARSQHRGDLRLNFAVETTLVLAEIGLLCSNLTACRRLLSQAESALSDRPSPILRLRWLRLRLALATTRGDTDAARSVLARAEELDTQNPWWQLAEARWWIDQGRHDRARERIRAVVSEPRSPSVLQVDAEILLARLHLQSQRIEAALEVAKRVLERARSERLEQHALAMELLVLALEGDSERAWTMRIQRAMQSRWSDLQLWAVELSARRAERLDDIELARSCWERLIQQAQLLGHQSVRRRAMSHIRSLSIQAIEGGPEAPTLS
jgi:serine/threonine protein kinase/tetratricopeptide (TPR) repeat protein